MKRGSMDLRTLSHLRQEAKKAIESFFYERKYLSCDVPIVVPCPGTEVYLDYFQTSWLDYQNVQHERFLRSSPELHLKMAMCSGMDRVFHLGKVFRNGGEYSKWHHPEFTMLEWYEAGIDFFSYMDQTELLVRHVHSELTSQGFTLTSLPMRFEKISMYDLFKNLLDIHLVDGDEKLSSLLIKRGVHSVNLKDDFETAYFKALIDVIEPYIEKKSAVFVYDYPPSQAALSQVVKGRAKRFELYINGVELCNAFQELLSREDNERRISESFQKRDILSKQAVPIDDDFLDALSSGMPPCCGNALGFDRLLAVLLGEDEIDGVIPFRTLRIFPAKQNNI